METKRPNGKFDERHCEAMSYSLKVDVDIVRILVDTTWAVCAREQKREFIALIKLEAESCSDTGHGKAQKAFASKLLLAMGEKAY